MGFVSKLRGIASGLARFIAQTHCQPLLILTAACLIVGEQYPLSNFPMYSSFGSKTFYLYLADGAGQPIACASAVGISTATLKKVFVSEMKRDQTRLHLGSKTLNAEQKRLVGERVLERLRGSPAAQKTAPAPGGLRLYQVDIALRDGRFEKRTEMIAELR